MGHYAGLGKVNYGMAIADGLGNLGNAVVAYNDKENERKRKREEEERNKKLHEIQYGNAELTKRELTGKLDEWDQGKDNRALERTNQKEVLTQQGNNLKYEAKTQVKKQEIAQAELEAKALAAKQLKQNTETKLLIEQNKLNDQQRESINAVANDWQAVANKTMKLEQFNEKYKAHNINISDLKQLDMGVFKANVSGVPTYKVDHPKLNGEQDMAFSFQVDEVMQTIPDGERDKVAVLLGKSLKGDLTAKVQLQKYKGANELLDYQDRFSPTAVPKQTIIDTQKQIDELNAIAAKNGVPVQPEIMAPLLKRIEGARAQLALSIEREEGPTPPVTDPAPPGTKPATKPEPLGNGIGGTKSFDPNRPLNITPNAPRNPALVKKQFEEATAARNKVDEAEIGKLASQALNTEIGKTHGSGKGLTEDQHRIYVKKVIAKLPKNPKYPDDFSKAAIEVAAEMNPSKKTDLPISKYFGNYFPAR